MTFHVRVRSFTLGLISLDLVADRTEDGTWKLSGDSNLGPSPCLLCSLWLFPPQYPRRMTLCFHANGFPIVTEVTHTEPLGSNHQASTALARSLGPVNTRPLRDVTQDHSRTNRTQYYSALREFTNQTRAYSWLHSGTQNFGLGVLLTPQWKLENPKLIFLINLFR
jgi:hypothetical protein